MEPVLLLFLGVDVAVGFDVVFDVVFDVDLCVAVIFEFQPLGPCVPKGRHIALQGNVVTQADCMQSEFPAAPKPFV
ncbi:hypothetical protein ACO0K9_25055 [Undibacterium sp. Ji50W]|uniref:hypothetical protein n=1 Tax=Undibacterium sp. Ji50W TaxID=3413041 RepID=UPI003BF24353